MNQHSFLKWEQASRDTIDFKVIYVDLAGDLVSGLMLSQIIYWHLPAKDGTPKLEIEHDGELWLAKRQEDWYSECRITPKQAQRCLAVLIEAGLIEQRVFKFAGSPTTHVRIVWDVFLKKLNELQQGTTVQGKIDLDQKVRSKLTKGEDRSYPKGKMEVDQRGRSYTESTEESTAESTRQRELSADADDAPSQLDDSLLFGEDEVVPKRETRHTRSARKLFEGLSKKRKVFREVNIDKWAAVFRSFMVETDITSEEFDETLAWYIEHAGEEFVPQAYSAGSFVEKFAKIRDQMLLGRNRLRGSSGRISVSEQNEESARIVKERIRNGTFGTRFEN